VFNIHDNFFIQNSA
jgi:predicted outer membrane repeat protein